MYYYIITFLKKQAEDTVKVLHLISGGDSGGAKTHVLSLLKNLNRQIQAELVCYTHGDFADEAMELGIPTTVFSGSFSEALRQTQEKISAEGFDIVHCHGSRANFTGALLKRRFDIPFISTVHSDYKLDYLGRPLAALTYGSLNKWALRRMDYRVCVSDKMRMTLIERGFDPNDLFAIYNGVDFSRPAPTITRREWFDSISCPFSDDDIVLGIGARLDPVKDVATTLRGFAKASRSCPRLRLLIAGDGLEREMLTQLAQELGVSDKVFFAGWVNGMDGFYASCDINAISSLSETFPYAVTEAARAGVPTVASRVGGLPRLLIPGETGMLFDPGDSDGMAKCIALLAENEEMRLSMGKAVYAKAKREFSTESTCSRQIEIYDAILKRRRSARSGVVICGAYGHGNAGDEAILKSVADSFMGLDPDMRITVVSKNARHTKLTRGINAIRRSHLFRLRRELKRSKLFISGGGSLIQDVTSRRSLWFYLYTMSLAKRCGCRVQMYGCGMGPLNYRTDRKWSAKVIDKNVDYITVRDPDSLRMLGQLGITKPKICLSGDPVLNLSGKSDGEVREYMREDGIDPDGRYLCISLRPWQGFAEVGGKIAEAIKRSCAKHELTPLFLPMNYQKDISACMLVANRLGDMSYIVAPCSDDVELDLALVRQMKAVVAMRLHGLLYATSGQVPAVGISYDPKVSGCAEYLGVHTIDLRSVTAENLSRAIDEALDEAASGKTAPHLEEIRRAEKMNLEVAKLLLEE